MLKTTLIHPQILFALGTSGHGSRVLIADGNYPFVTGSPSEAEMVFLNLRPGTVGVSAVLETLVSVIPIESASVMQPRDDQVPSIFADFARLLPDGAPIEKLERFAFYEKAGESRTSLVIATGETLRFANILLTIGVVTHGTQS